MTAYQLHGEIGYISEESFQARFSMDWFDYLKQQTERKPWGLVPFRMEFSLEDELFRNFRVTADAFILSGSYYLQKGKSGKTPGAFDMNVGVSYQISKNFGLWVNANNIFNSNYQRWHNYPALGSNLIGGLLIKF
ncbi:MAG TPA: TonB-dependent receptor [Chitinophagaceae bacterium]|nr:TonB-dependent receptor [Chitinophagaceae bacterium]